MPSAEKLAQAGATMDKLPKPKPVDMSTRRLAGD